jgi:hypothetical protein
MQVQVQVHVWVRVQVHVGVPNWIWFCSGEQHNSACLLGPAAACRKP